MCHQALIGREVTFDGSLWNDDRYKNKTYHGTVAKLTRPTRGLSKGYDLYHVKIRGEKTLQKFSLSDLLAFGFITDDEYTSLNNEYQY